MSLKISELLSMNTKLGTGLWRWKTRAAGASSAATTTRGKSRPTSSAAAPPSNSPTPTSPSSILYPPALLRPTKSKAFYPFFSFDGVKRQWSFNTTMVVYYDN